MAFDLPPPTHRIDAPPVWISPHDAAWDNDKFKADLLVFREKEFEAAKAAAVEKYQLANPGRELPADEIEAVRADVEFTDEMAERARLRSPVVRYLRGVTRFSLAAPGWDGNGAPCTVRDYFLPGSTPNEILLRRLPYADYQRADSLKDGHLRCADCRKSHSVNNGYNARCLTEFCRLGLRAIKSPKWNWQAERDGYATEEVLQALFKKDPALLETLGMAVVNICRPLDPEETLT